MNRDDLLRYDQRVPRYTSYPTAADFSPAVDAGCYGDWLAALPAGEEISLYLHIPFCREMCWFCGCHTTVARGDRPVDAYLTLIEREIDLLADSLGPDHPVVHIHWGGGTPTILGPDGISRLAGRLHDRFSVTSDAQFAVEVDPRIVTNEIAMAMAEAGVNRASLGVQDFDAKVQRAINRIQPYDMTAQVVDWLRGAGIEALNIDLIYGLPEQTIAGITATVDAALKLEPQRIALYGYAHVPWMKRHQKLIDEAALPNTAQRVALCEAATAGFLEHGYVAIGLDHLALPTDSLAVAAREGTLRRNFQGYTTEPAEVLLGLGTSAIGTLPQGYVQNASRTTDYRAAIEGGDFATARGIAVTDDDRLRRRLIERLMCDFEVDLAGLCGGADEAAAEFAEDIAALAPLEAQGVVRVDGNRVRVMPEARLLLRVVCAVFDRRLRRHAERHAVAV
jgi:oxygen-independent coproporphyrinogen-3 oxidase